MNILHNIKLDAILKDMQSNILRCNIYTVRFFYRNIECSFHITSVQKYNLTNSMVLKNLIVICNVKWNYLFSFAFFLEHCRMNRIKLFLLPPEEDEFISRRLLISPSECRAS